MGSGLTQRVETYGKDDWKCNILFRKIYYAAPEVIANNFNEKCDIWSLGVVLYVMITAQFPFNGPDDKTIIKNITNSNFTTESIFENMQYLLYRLVQTSKTC
jgi:calcium-dependent protein kinase